MAQSCISDLQTDQQQSRRVESALRHHDALLLHGLASRARNTDVFFDQVRKHTFNIFHRQVDGSSAPMNSSMLLWPIVLDPGLLRCSPWGDFELSSEAAIRVATQLSACTGSRTSVGLLRALFGYNMVSWAGPMVFRQLLEQLAQSCRQAEVPLNGAGAIPIEQFVSGVPADAPLLYFLMGSLTCSHGWPEFLPGTAHPTVDLRQDLDAALRMELCLTSSSMDLTLEVGVPGFACAAIESGLICWLRALGRQYRFTHWDVLFQEDHRVDLLIEFEHGEIAPLQIPMRSYQLGAAGMEQVMAGLDSLMPSSAEVFVR